MSLMEAELRKNSKRTPAANEPPAPVEDLTQVIVLFCKFPLRIFLICVCAYLGGGTIEERSRNCPEAGQTSGCECLILGECVLSYA